MIRVSFGFGRARGTVPFYERIYPSRPGAMYQGSGSFRYYGIFHIGFRWRIGIMIK